MNINIIIEKFWVKPQGQTRAQTINMIQNYKYAKEQMFTSI